MSQILKPGRTSSGRLFTLAGVLLANVALTLENYSAAVHNEVNLVELCDQLEKVVAETVQPKSVTLWMRKDR